MNTNLGKIKFKDFTIEEIFSKIYKKPLSLDDCSMYIFDNKNQMVFDSYDLSSSPYKTKFLQGLVELINNNKNNFEDRIRKTIFSESSDIFYIDENEVKQGLFSIRGWGYLTSILKFDYETASKIYDIIENWIVSQVKQESNS